MVEDCTHTKLVVGHWEKTKQYYGATNPKDEDWIDDEWVGGYDKPTTIDINLHQYQCTQCKKIMNY